MNNKRLASELVRLAKELNAGGIGKFDSWAESILSDIVEDNLHKSDLAILRLVKQNKDLSGEIYAEGITNEEIKRYIAEERSFFEK